MGNLLDICKKIPLNDKTSFELSLLFPGTATNNRKGQEITWYEYCKLENPNHVAIVDYEKQEPDEIKLHKNDLLILINARERTNYCLIKNLRTRLIGKVPRNALRPYSQPRMEAWFHKNITKFDAERFLISDKNETGCYMLRDSSSMEIALSVLNVNSNTMERKVYHYLIKRDESNKYFIENKNASNLRYFLSIDELINFYKSNKELCCKLTSFYKKTSEFEIEWEIDRNRILFDKEIGGGQFGIVFKAKLRLQKEYDVAVKMIRNSNERQKELFINECNLMKRLKHDKIIKLYCISCKEDPMCMILEYMPNGSLKNYLKNNKTTLKFKSLIDIIIQISAGMKYLEEIQVIHRDLSARNVMVGKENLVKIGDFGLSQKLLDGVIDKRVDLPIKWMAPEVLNEMNLIYTTKSDVWSFGILLYEIITHGSDPYPRNNTENQGKESSYSNEEVKSKILDGYRMNKPDGLCTDVFYSIMKECWKKNPEERPTFEALYNSFFDYFVKSEPQYQMN